MSAFNAGALGVSPPFSITAEELILNYFTAVTRIAIDGVEPPSLGAYGGSSVAFNLKNHWFPWIDEKLVEPKFDGVCQHLGVVSNRPTVFKDFHMITLMRAIDYILTPQYYGYITAEVDTVLPEPPPTPTTQ
jgi:hypothetical protein